MSGAGGSARALSRPAGDDGAREAVRPAPADRGAGMGEDR
jgi:hypothetical protein